MMVSSCTLHLDNTSVELVIPPEYQPRVTIIVSWQHMGSYDHLRHLSIVKAIPSTQMCIYILATLCTYEYW
jgi:hypothetical protein